MKKFIKSFILALCLVLPTFCLTACDNTEHEHEFATEWSSDASYHYHACTGDDCEKITDKAAHTFGEWTTSTYATCTTEGEKYRECSECGYKETQEIPATGHTFGEFIIDETPTTQSAGEGHRECSVCHYKSGITISALKSTGLLFELNSDKASYTLAGMGTCTDTFINIPNTHNGLPVTAIENGAFRGITTITGIILTNNITTIGKNAFTDCSNLTNITIPDSVTSIGKYAFANCSKLTSITIPNNLTSIESGVFSQCSGLISVIIPNSVIEIELLAFNGCSSLENVYFTGTTEQWNSIDIKDSNDKLKSATKYFYSETIPQELGSNFWHYENGVPELWPAHTEHSYGDLQKDETYHWRVCSYCGFEDKNTHSFSEGYSNNETNHWHECVCGVHDEDVAHTFKNGICDYCNFERIELAFNYLESSNSYEVSDIGRITSDVIDIPSTYDDGTHGTLAVTSIKNNAFQNEKTITSITISNSVITIGDYAFAGCTQLESVTIPNSVTTLGDYVFNHCINLTSAVVGNGITTLSKYTFSGCEKLIDITIGSGVTTIGQRAFAYCEALRLVTIPNGVTTIKDGAFSQCKGLVNIIIPNNVTTIGENAFASCTGATSIVLGSRITTIGVGAFYNCTNVTSVIIPNSVRSIAESAFSANTSLEKTYYVGTEEQWSLLKSNIGINNGCLTGHVYFLSETQPTTTGNFWHYVDGVPTAW